jgi:hypothetical protein
MRITRFFTALGFAAAFAALPRAQAPDLDTLLDKAGDYVADYEQTFVGVVAEEAYRQQVRVPGGGRDVRGFPTDATVQRRDLKSDVLLVRAPGGDRWIQFRDVFEVDGKPVRDREERLTKLFLQPSADARRQELDIATASARYNIGAVNRTVNLPVLALSVLEAKNRPWFAFKIGKHARATVELEFKEEERGRTMIHGNDDQPVPAHGHFTIETDTGRVLASVLATETPTLRAQIEVSYGAEPSIDMLVPREMRETYRLKDGSVTEGRATYAKIRRYQVKVDEKVGTVKK